MAFDFPDLLKFSQDPIQVVFEQNQCFFSADSISQEFASNWINPQQKYFQVGHSCIGIQLHDKIITLIFSCCKYWLTNSFVK